MNKKILAILAFFIVIVGMSTVCAFDLNDLLGGGSSNNATNSSDNVTIEGVAFKIPSGFEEVLNDSSHNHTYDNPYVNFTFTSKSYVNGSASGLHISVSQANEIKANDTIAEYISLGGNKTTINGVNGYIFDDIVGYGFTYAKDGKLVVVSSDDKALFNETVVA
jgi:hypothetical protein